jgi:hypothetical protein
MVIIGVVMVIRWAWAILDDKARKPESEPKPNRAVLEEATIYVTGDDGGTFNLAWEVRPPGCVKGEKENVTGVSQTTPYSLPPESRRTRRLRFGIRVISESPRFVCGGFRYSEYSP